MSSGNGDIPFKASGRLVYFGTDEIEDVQGAIGTIGAALHFAADHLEQFREETNAHNARHHHAGPVPEPPSLEAYRAVLVFTHDMVSPDCVEAIP